MLVLPLSAGLQHGEYGASASAFRPHVWLSGEETGQGNTAMVPGQLEPPKTASALRRICSFSQLSGTLSRR